LFPKRDRPVPDFNKVIHVKKIHKKRLVKSSFWKEVISKNYDCMLNIDPKEVEYHICAGKKQVKYEGFWYITKPTKGNDPPEIEIFQVNRNIVDMNGRLEMILFNSRWRQYYLGREFSHAKGTVRDVIVWTDNDRNELVWRRYTNVMALHTVVLKKEKLYLPDRLTSLIQEFLGEKTWRFQRDKEKKDKTVVSRFEAKRVEIVTFMIKLLKLKNMDRMREFRADIIKMDDELMLRKWGISDLAAMLPLFPTDAEVAQMRGARVSEKSALIERWFFVISRVPDISKRMKLWAFTHTFNDNLYPTTDTLSKLQHTAEELLSSTSLKQMFGLTLQLCNFCNENRANMRNMYGFRIDSLSAIPRTTLEYLVQLAYEKFPSSLNFIKEFEGKLTDVITSDFAQLQNNFQTLESELRSITRELENGTNQGREFRKYMGRFVTGANLKIDTTREFFDTVLERFHDLEVAFCTPGDFTLGGAHGQGLEGIYVLEDFRCRMAKVHNHILRQEKTQRDRLRLEQGRVERQKRIQERKQKLKQSKAAVDKKAGAEDHPVLRFVSRRKRKIFKVEETPAFQELLKVKARMDQHRQAKLSTSV